jgi:K+-sensing histidine kinase KdpD
MGMGLSIARTIIEAHRGLISAKNRDHGGASFRIRLPPSDQQPDLTAKATGSDPVA